MGPAIRLIPVWLGAAALLAGAGFDTAKFKFYRNVMVDARQGVCTMGIDKTIYLGAEPGLPDLRLVHGAEEIPYVLEALNGTYEETAFAAAIQNRGVLRGAGLQLTLDVGTAAKHNRLRVVTRKQNFRTQVTIETSAESRKWAVVRSNAYVFSFTQDGRRTDGLDLDYPMSTRRFMRVTFADLKQPSDVERIEVTRLDAQPAIWSTLATPGFSRVEKDRSSLLEFDLGSDHIPVSRVRVETTGTPFQRTAQIEVSHDRQDWSVIATTTIYRFTEDLTPVDFEFAEQHRRYLRLTIFNQDDQPVPIRKVDFEVVAQRLKFLAREGGTYRLYYGASDVTSPQYDLASILSYRLPSSEVSAALGPEVVNPDFRAAATPPRPWSERHPELIYITLAAALVGMGWISLRFIRGLRSSG